ncbi:MAG: cytochrome c [Candidatus Acidiferrales bacterium]|jgi:mono/diheme cytochrome c family protein
MKAFVVGVLAGVLLLAGGVYYYFVSGLAPAAAADDPMPMEKTIASRSLNAHIDKANISQPPISVNEENYVAGAKLYMDHCAWCHGLPDQSPPEIASKMYPHATLLFKGKGVTDDPPQESYWKAANGIRLSGMPSFKDTLNDTQLWQLALLVANADKIPDSAKKILVPGPLPEAPSVPAPTPATPPVAKK